MVDRFWGEDKDREACRQLGLEGDQTIFMVSVEVDYVDDLQVVAREFAGLCDAEEVIEAVEERVRSVKLPKGWFLVGVKPIEENGPETYGLVDFTGFKEKQQCISAHSS